MPRLFALADLHLSLAGHKPMDLFGEIWRDHAIKMAAAWDGGVAPEDTVLLAGDLSWARNLEEARVDLEWIGARPGRKLLLRGNHDSWWNGQGRVRRALPAGCDLIHNNAFRVEDRVIVGARGWLSPDDPLAEPTDERIWRREIGRLRLSTAAADRAWGRELPRLAVLHYPPWIEGRPPTELVDVLQESGATACVYGHLHGEDHRLAVRGERRGIRFHFVAADAVGFAPVEIPAEGVA